MWLTKRFVSFAFLKKDSLKFVCLAVSVFISLQHENRKSRQVLLNIFLGNKSPQSHTILGFWLDSQDSLQSPRKLLVKSLCKHPMNWGIHLCIVRLITVQGRNPTNHHKGFQHIPPQYSFQNSRIRVLKITSISTWNFSATNTSPECECFNWSRFLQILGMRLQPFCKARAKAVRPKSRCPKWQPNRWWTVIKTSRLAV